VLESLTADDFRTEVGATYVMAGGPEEAAEIRLVEVREGDAAPGRPRRAFALEFEACAPGPGASQGTYRLDREGHTPLEIFLVPVGPDPGTGLMRYEAIFT
jgi:hypothetical protein